MSLRNKTKDGRDETDGEKGCNRLRPTRMAQNYYGLKTKNQISSFLTMGNLNIYTHTTTRTNTKPVEGSSLRLRIFCNKISNCCTKL